MCCAPAQVPCAAPHPSAKEEGSRHWARDRAKAMETQTRGSVRETKVRGGAPEGGLELPVDCIAAVLSKCSPRDICRLSCVSRAWSQAGCTEEAWASCLPLRCRESLPSHFPRVHHGATPRETARVLSEGVLSRDGSFFLALHPATGKLRVHVSASRALLERPRSEDGRLVWRRLGGVPGAVFDPCGLLVTGRGMRVHWDIQTPFALPQGTFAVSWRVGSQGGQGSAADPSQRFCDIAGPAACLRASLLPPSPSPQSPHSPHTPHSQETPPPVTPGPAQSPSRPSGAAVLSPEVQVLDLSKVVGEAESDIKGGAWDEDLARRAAAGWHALVPCAVHCGAAGGTGLMDAPEGRGAKQERAGPSATRCSSHSHSHSHPRSQSHPHPPPHSQPHSHPPPPSQSHSHAHPHSQPHFQPQPLSPSLIPESMRRRLSSLWPFARCTCREAVALQQQHLALLKQISGVETMQWEYIKLGTVQHKAADTVTSYYGAATAAKVESGPGNTIGEGGALATSGLHFSVLLEEHAANQGKSKLHVDGIVLTLL